MALPYINMNLPQVYTCSPSWTLLPPPSPYHPSGSSQCTHQPQASSIMHQTWTGNSFHIWYYTCFNAIPRTSVLKQVFSTALFILWAKYVFVMEDCPKCYRMLAAFLVSTQDASNTPGVKQKYLQTLPGICWVVKSPLITTTGLKQQKSIPANYKKKGGFPWYSSG